MKHKINTCFPVILSFKRTIELNFVTYIFLEGQSYSSLWNGRIKEEAVSRPSNPIPTLGRTAPCGPTFPRASEFQPGYCHCCFLEMCWSIRGRRKRRQKRKKKRKEREKMKVAFTVESIWIIWHYGPFKDSLGLCLWNTNVHTVLNTKQER